MAESHWPDAPRGWGRRKVRQTDSGAGWRSSGDHCFGRNKKSVRPATKLAIDFSNHQRYLTPEIARCWKEHGVEKVIVRISAEDAEKIAITRQQLQVCADAGFEIEGYLWLYFKKAYPPEIQVAAAMDVLQGFSIGTLWIDCEESEIDASVRPIDYIQRAVAACPLPTGIYTNRYWWRDHTGDSDSLSNLPLWLAFWDGVADLDVWIGPFAGWGRLTTKQYIADYPLCGRSVDLNICAA